MDDFRKVFIKNLYQVAVEVKVAVAAAEVEAAAVEVAAEAAVVAVEAAVEAHLVDSQAQAAEAMV